MHPRARDVRRGLWLSVVSIGWSAVVGAIAVYTALRSGSLSLLGFGGDAILDATVSVTLVWRFASRSAPRGSNEWPRARWAWRSSRSRSISP